MPIFDIHEIFDLKKTRDGFVVSKARLARSGIQVYLAGDPGLGGAFSDRAPTSQIRIYRPADEVFSPEAMESYAGLPITIEHRGGFVTPDNAGSLIVGWVGDTISRDGDLVAGNVRVVHKAGLDALDSGKRELSVGYDCQIDVKAGKTPTGEAYDGTMTQIRANHVALVSNGRCGPSCRVHDAADCSGSCSERKPMAKTIDFNGVAIEVTDQAAQAFDALKASHAKALDEKTAEIVSLTEKAKSQDSALAKAEARADGAEAKLKDAEAKLTPQALDAAARDRAKLCEDALVLAPKLDTKPLDAAGIRREALKAAGVALDGKSEDYVTAAFDARVDTARAKGGTAAKGADSLANRTQTEDAGDARSKYLARQANAYKMEARS